MADMTDRFMQRVGAGRFFGKSALLTALLCAMGLSLVFCSPVQGQDPAQGQETYASTIGEAVPGTESPLADQGLKDLSASQSGDPGGQFVPLAAATEVTPALSHMISMQMEGATVEEALEAVAGKAGLRLSYSSKAVDVGENVSLSFEQVTAYKALKQVLRGTGLSMVASDSGQLILTSRFADKPRSAALKSFRLAPARLLSVRAIRVKKLQTGTITGTVTDAESGDPIPGANVSVQGTQRGAATNGQGQYTIEEVPAGEQIMEVGFVGYQTQSRIVQVPDGGTATVNFELASSRVTLDELVVTATGEQQKKELANAVTQIPAAELVDEAPVSNVSDLLTGRAPGVQVTSSGTLGGGSRIRIRGVSSVSLSNEPLVYVDGVRIASGSASTLNVGGQTTSFLNSLNPQNIASIEIVKGPSATTLYGTQAANGVIRITTKDGSAGSNAHLWMEAGAVTDPNDYPAVWRAETADGSQCNLIAMAQGDCQIAEVRNFDLMENAQTSPFRTGLQREIGGSLSGAAASESISYFTSAEVARREGTLPNNNSRQVSFATKVHYAPVEELNVDVSGNFVSNTTRLPNNDNSSLGILAQGLLGGTPEPGGWWRFSPEQLYNLETRQSIRRFIGNFSSVWTPLAWLRMRGSAGFDLAFQEDTQHLPPGEVPRGRDILGFRNVNTLRSNRYTAELSATASFSFTEDITSESSLGVQYYDTRESGTLSHGEVLIAGTESLAGAGVTNVSESVTQTKTLGFFLQEQIGFNDRLFLTVGARVDDNSTFGRDFDQIIYPKLGASWLISEEGFFSSSNFLNSFKLRAAWGQSGNQPGVTDALTYLQAIPVVTPEGDQAVGTTFLGGGLGNPNLKPELSSEIEAGFDAVLLDQRLDLDFTYYNSTTEDALIFRDLPTSIGTVGGRFENLGIVSNSGIELALNTFVVDTENIDLDLEVNASYNTNELIELGEGIVPIIAESGVRHVEGFPLGGYWDRPIENFEDVDGNGVLAPNEVTVGDSAEFLGPSIPTTQISVSPTIRLFDHVTITGLLNYSGGHKLSNATAEFRCGRANNRARNDPSVSLAEQARCIASTIKGTSAGYIEDADYTTLGELSVTFNSPGDWAKRLAGASRLSLTLSGRNLFIWTDYSGVDPRINRFGGANFATEEFLTLGPSRNWSARLNISF